MTDYNNTIKLLSEFLDIKEDDIPDFASTLHVNTLPVIVEKKSIKPIKISVIARYYESRKTKSHTII